MKVISMFSGAGGLDLGFCYAGHEIVWANDFDKDAVETYKLNFNKFSEHNIVLGDIVEYLNQDEKIINKIVPDADIVIGGFPCQGFSIANLNRSMEDSRNYLYLQILKMIKIKNPKYFLLENVKGLSNMLNGEVLKMIINDLENCGNGYTVFYNIINALDYGVPQNRERVIIYGARNDIKKLIELPIYNESISDDKIVNKKILHIPNTHSLNSVTKQKKPSYFVSTDIFNKMINKKSYNYTDYFKKGKIYCYQTLQDTIKDLPEETNNDNTNILNHVSSKCKPVSKNSKKSNYVGNRPTEWTKWSPTIMGRGSGTGGPLIIPHPEYDRRMSVREVARIQTFPDTFEFLGSTSAQYRQIGNAVPILMAYNIATLFR